MKTWFLSLLLLVFLSTSIRAAKKQLQGKSKTKQHECKNVTSTENRQAEPNNKSKCLPIGQFSLKLPTKSKHTNEHRTPKQTKKKSSVKMKKIMRELRKCMDIKHKDVKCDKGKKNAKKAMIWPKKMLPTLEKMLLNKVNGVGNGNLPGDNNGDNGFENYDNPSDNSYENAFSPTTSSTSSFGKNDFSDNWDSVNPRHHKAKFHGMDVVPLLKMLKEKVGDTSSFDSNAFTGTPSNQGGSKYLTKLLLSQALGKPDKGAVMKDMMQEFFLANGNERSGEEAREAFNELVGHNNLVAFNSQLEAENSDVNVGNGAQGMQGSEGSQAISQKIPSLGSQAGVLQAQELPNGQIAPLNQQTTGQRMIASRPVMQQMMAQAANPTTRMLNDGPNVPNVPSIPNMPNVPNVVSNDVQLQSELAARIAAEQNSQARPIPFAKSNNLVFEEQGESAARGIRPPPFQAAQRTLEAERVMNLGASYQSSPIREPQRPVMSPVPQRVEMEMRGGEPNVIGMQGERFGDEVAAYFPQSYAQQELAARRDALPSSHKHKTTKAPMRSKDLPTPHKAKNKS